MLFSLNSNAHEFWIVPHGKTSLGSTVSISARVGAEWPGSQVIKLPDMVESLSLFYGNSSEENNINSRDNSYVFGHYRVNKTGTQTIILTTRNFELKLSANEFNEYLKEEGLENVLNDRIINKQNTIDSHEIYSRIAKSIVYIGKDDAYKRNFGLPLEISIASEIKPKNQTYKITLKITKNNHLLVNQLIKAQLQDKETKIKESRSDENGLVSFDLPCKGFWRFSTVSIQPVINGDIQWKSTWSSTTIKLD